MYTHAPPPGPGGFTQEDGPFMARFLLVVPHEATKEACIQAIDLFLQTGSHFLTNADWGCKDGEHKAWIIVDVDTREEARSIVPPLLRAHARIVQLNAFTPQDLANMLGPHQP